MQAQGNPRKRTEVHPGDRYGRLVVLRGREGLDTRVIVRCDCGEVKSVNIYNLIRNTRSCGCLRIELASARSRGRFSHGHCKNGTATQTYNSWVGAVKRCTNRTTNGYENYGGRGIGICERWHSFENFLADMGERPDGMSLDRIDPNGDYEPSNCRWATASEQQRNTRRARGLPSNLTVREALDLAGVPKFGRSNGLGRRIEHLLALLEKHGIPVDETP